MKQKAICPHCGLEQYIDIDNNMQDEEGVRLCFSEWQGAEIGCEQTFVYRVFKSLKVKCYKTEDEESLVDPLDPFDWLCENDREFLLEHTCPACNKISKDPWEGSFCSLECCEKHKHETLSELNDLKEELKND